MATGAQLTRMQAIRGQLPARVRVEREPSADFARNGRLHQANLAVGYASVPDRAAGPRVILAPPYEYLHTEGAKTESEMIASFPVFTITEKMSCFSFSLPAGTTDRAMGGTCQFAAQATTERLAQTARAHPELRAQFAYAGAHPQSPYICASCYAIKGAYTTYPLVALRQVWRLAWVNAALYDGDTYRPGRLASYLIAGLEFIRNLSDAAHRANKTNPNYFRIHDSGDFFAAEYYQEWLEVIRRFESARDRVFFWAPTRMWVSPVWQQHFRAHGIPKNFALRPSALFFGAHAPALEFTDAGSTASAEYQGSLRDWVRQPSRPFPKARPEVVWDCPAYDDTRRRNKMMSCAEARCRVCWLAADVAVSYKAH